MRVFVTGLCLQGNKGGAALALSLMGQVRKCTPDARFVFSVPAEDLQLEAGWGRRYGVGVVPDFAINSPSGLARSRKWISVMASADVVLDLSGISYVGPPARTPGLDKRLRYSLLARAARKPFLAWTQSYGPFTHPMVNAQARIDLGTLDYVFCRGESTRREVCSLLPAHPRVVSFPDVATTLHFDTGRGAQILSGLGLSGSRPLVTISPSAVNYAKTSSQSGNGHVSAVAELCRHLIDTGHDVVLVPHTRLPDGSPPSNCDFAVATAIRSRLADTAPCWTVADDLSAPDLKSVISTARLHVGARYHSLVASLSSGVPTVAMSWHHKYQDLLTEYGVAENVWEGTGTGTVEDLLALCDRALGEASLMRQRIESAQERVESEVENNRLLFAAWLKEFRL